MKFFITIFSVFYLSFTSCHSNSNNDNAIAYLDEQNNTIINKELVKEKVRKNLGKRIDSLNIKDVQIYQLKTIGERAIESYIIQFSDPDTNQRLAKYLFLYDGKFYFYEDVQKEWNLTIDENSEAFFLSYYLIKGKTEDECLPNIAFMDGELYWITGTELVCAPDSPCKSDQILVM